jgi:uncharacterized membrane protein
VTNSVASDEGVRPVGSDLTLGGRGPHGSGHTLEGVRSRGSDPTSARVTGLVRDHVWSLAVWAAMLAWSAGLFAVVRDHFVNYRLGRYDLGNMVQAVWSTAEGRPLEITHGTTGEQIVRLGSHVDPILAALAPLWIVVPSPLTLVAVQIVAVALGALPLFWLGRRHLGSERTAALVALAYLAYPWIAWTAVDAFHPVTLAIPALLFAVWFLDSDRLLPFAVCGVLAMATGELMGVVVAGLGVWYAVARKRRGAGFAITAAGIGWTLFALYAIVPRFSGGESAFYGFYEHVGGSPWGILRTALTDPLAILSAVGQGRDLLYVFLLATPVAFVFLLAPGLAAVALPQLAANHLADLSSATDPHAHYVAGILPFFFAAIAIGLGRLSPTGRVRGAILVLTLSLAATIMVGPWPWAVGGPPSFYRLDTPSEHIAAVGRAIGLVPDDAPLSTTNRAGSHLSARRYLYSVPVIGRAEWVVLDSSDAWIPREAGGDENPEALRSFQERLEKSSEWRRVYAVDGVFVFRRLPG